MAVRNITSIVRPLPSTHGCSDIFDLKYKVQNPLLSEQCRMYGVITCMRQLQSCVVNELGGYIAGKRIDKAFLSSLSSVDKDIYKAVITWLGPNPWYEKSMNI